MKILKNFIVYTLVACLFIGNTFFSYTFAEGESNEEENKCSACNSTPNSMQILINFEVEMLGILQGVSGKAESLGTNKSSGLFAGGSLNLSKAFYQSTKEKIKADIDSEAKAVRAAGITTVLLGIMGAEAKDSMYSIEILRKDEAYVRDYKILQELDMAINDIIWDMGTLGIRNKSISSSVQSDIMGLQSKYSQLYGKNGAIFERFLVSSNAKYSNISMFLLRLNSFMKSTLMALGESTPALDTSVSRLENLYSKGSIVVVLNKDYIKSIRMDYSCVSLSVCSKTLRQARNDLSNIPEYGKSFGKSLDTIKDAIRNLKEAYGTDGIKSSSNKKDNNSENKILTDKQVELLHTVYGLDASKLTTSQQENIAQNFEKEMKPLKEGLEDTKVIVKEMGEVGYIFLKSMVNSGLYGWNKVVSLFNKIMDKGSEGEQNYINGLTEQEKEDLESKLFWQKNIPISEYEKNLIENMQNTVYEILIEKGQDKESILVGVNQDAHYFVEIGGLIHSIVEDEIGDKNTEGLVKILGEICEYQCKNHGGKCYK